MCLSIRIKPKCHSSLPLIYYVPLCKDYIQMSMCIFAKIASKCHSSLPTMYYVPIYKDYIQMSLFIKNSFKFWHENCVASNKDGKRKANACQECPHPFDMKMLFTFLNSTIQCLHSTWDRHKN